MHPIVPGKSQSIMKHSFFSLHSSLLRNSLKSKASRGLWFEKHMENLRQKRDSSSTYMFHVSRQICIRVVPGGSEFDSAAASKFKMLQHKVVFHGCTICLGSLAVPPIISVASQLSAVVPTIFKACYHKYLKMFCGYYSFIHHRHLFFLRFSALADI